MKSLFAGLLLLSTAAFASSDVTSLVNSKGDLVILIIDRVSNQPYEAALLWASMTGDSLTKQIKNQDFSLTCATTVHEATKERSGSCRLVLAKEKLAHTNGYFGGIVSDKEILSKLYDFNHSFAGGKLLITVDHTQKALGIKIDEDIIK